MNNNYLYIAHNEDGFVKIGITDKKPENRVNDFGNKYEKNFKILMSFKVDIFDNTEIETLIHQFLNTQLLNVSLLYNACNVTEFENYTKNSPDGYTEIFLSKPIFLANCLMFLHMCGAISLTNKNLGDLMNLKEYPIEELREKYKTKINEMEERQNKKSPLSKVSKSEVTFNSFISLGTESCILKMENHNNDFFLVDENNKINLANFLHDNNDFKLLENLLEIRIQESTRDELKTIVVLLKKENKDITTQRNNSWAIKQKNNKVKERIKNNKKLKEMLINECDNIIEDLKGKNVPSCCAVFFTKLKEEIKENNYLEKINLNCLNGKNSFNEYCDRNTSEEAKENIKRLSILLDFFKSIKSSEIDKFKPNINSLRRYVNNFAKAYSDGTNSYVKEKLNMKKLCNVMFWNKGYFDYASAVFKGYNKNDLLETIINDPILKDECTKSMRLLILLNPQKLENFDEKDVLKKIMNEEKNSIVNSVNDFYTKNISIWHRINNEEEKTKFTNLFLKTVQIDSECLTKSEKDKLTKQLDGFFHRRYWGVKTEESICQITLKKPM